MKKPRVGIICFGPATFVTVSFILSQIATRRCDYASLDTPNSEAGLRELEKFADYNDKIPGYDWENKIPSSVGLFCWQSEDGGEHQYNDEVEFDSKHKSARAFSFVSTICGAIAWVSFIVGSCLSVPPAGWMILSALLLVTCLFESLTFVFFDSDLCLLDCGMDTGSRCGVAAAVLWFVSTLLTSATAAKMKKERNDSAASETTAEKKEGEKASADASNKDKEDSKKEQSDEDTAPHDHADDVEKQLEVEDVPLNEKD